MKNKTIAILAVSISIVAAIVAVVVYKRIRAQEYDQYQRCVALYESEQYPKAIELLNEFLEKYPENEYSADALYRLAKANQKTNDYANAEKAWKKLIDKPHLSQKRKAEAHYKKGLCQEDLGKIDAAIESYKAVTSLHIASKDYVPSAWYRLGRLYEEKDSKADAAYAYQKLVENYPEHKSTQTAAEKLGDWNLDHFLDENTIIYHVKSGDRIQTIARRYNTVPELIKKMNGLKSDMIRLGQTLRIPQEVDFNIEIGLKRKVLNLKHDGKIIKQYPVCVGDKDHPTPGGVFKIVNKLVNPEWRSPDGRIVPPNAPDNELGTRWIGIANEEIRQIAGYGIHGTIEPESIGKACSRGCVRMYNKDVEELFDLVRRGTQVVIRDEIESEEWYVPNFAKADK